MLTKSDLTPLLGKSLSTLGHRKNFKIIDIDEKRIIIKPDSSGIERPIKFSEIQNTHNQVCTQGFINLKGIRAYCEFSPVCIAAILVELPNISFTSKPIISYNR